MKFIPVIIILLFPLAAAAQTTESLSTDRPGQAMNPNTAGKGFLQIQSGLGYNFYNYDDGYLEITSKSFTPDAVIRYGLFEKFEINSTVNFLHENTINNDHPFKSTGLSGIGVGARYNIKNLSEHVYALGVGLSLYHPIYFYTEQIETPNQRLTLAANAPLLKKLLITANTGLESQQLYFFDFITGLHVLNVSGNITNKLSAFIECYKAFLWDLDELRYFRNKYDAGLAFLVNNNLQLDVYAGYSTQKKVEYDWFVNIGVSWRTQLLNKAKSN